LKAFGAGIELTLLAAIPAGSAWNQLDLAATVLVPCGFLWFELDKNEMGREP
jgi:hypothetical protein